MERSKVEGGVVRCSEEQGGGGAVRSNVEVGVVRRREVEGGAVRRETWCEVTCRWGRCS